MAGCVTEIASDHWSSYGEVSLTGTVVTASSLVCSGHTLEEEEECAIKSHECAGSLIKTLDHTDCEVSAKKSHIDKKACDGKPCPATEKGTGDAAEPVLNAHVKLTEESSVRETTTESQKPHEDDGSLAPARQPGSHSYGRRSVAQTSIGHTAQKMPARNLTKDRRSTRNPGN